MLLAGARRRGLAAVAFVERQSVVRVLGAFVVAQWLAVLALARVVRHAGWIYYQGGDQLWYYTLGWLLGHGELTQTRIGYLWSALLAPLSWIAGPNAAAALPAIATIDVVVLLPLAMLAFYGIAARIGGKLFGYWAMLLWLAVPFVGILYTNQGYHQRYTELFLPQAFGLTGMADFPAMVAAVVAVYFCVRATFDAAPRLVDAVAGGTAAGAAIAIKPSAVLFVAGPALAFAYARRFALAGVFAAALAPALVTLAVWKERGLGNLPVLNGAPPVREHALAAAAPLAGLDLHKYLPLNWTWFTRNIDLLREHFWSGRLLVWLILAGTLGLARRSPKAALLVGGWFFAFAIVKGSYTGASVEDGSLFRIMMPSYPAFVLLLASVPFLLPRVARRVGSWSAPFTTPARFRWAAVAAGLAVTAVAPLAAIAAADRTAPTDAATLNATIMPVPSSVDLHVEAHVAGRRVDLSWRNGKPLGSPVFYRVWRARTDGRTCTPQAGAPLCNVSMAEVGVTRGTAFVDHAPRGRWFYRVAVAANWLDDPQYGDPYVLSAPLEIRVP